MNKSANFNVPILSKHYEKIPDVFTALDVQKALGIYYNASHAVIQRMILMRWVKLDSKGSPKRKTQTHHIYSKIKHLRKV
jgi:hypothetical protein